MLRLLHEQLLQLLSGAQEEGGGLAVSGDQLSDGRHLRSTQLMTQQRFGGLHAQVGGTYGVSNRRYVKVEKIQNNKILSYQQHIFKKRVL